ncbi:MAG: hypothetical protein A2V86_16895 [Deltaproteobacteria bacterium RBG_16_49_23]|nr:MAG: hypothetical protein A2V86_16895 [Deltaproteobacteria bacterium RBG_16_49_23]
MKRYAYALSFVFLLLWFGIGSAFDMTARTGFIFDWWKDTEDNRGRQFYTPIELEARHGDISLSLLTAYGYTHFDGIAQPVPFFAFFSNKEDRSLTHFLDTKLNFSYEIVGKLPVDILLGLDFNLPTGKTDLRAKDLAAIMDPDLISINNFGEGFNINPTLSLARELGDWVFGISAGYLWRGKYDFGFTQETPFFAQKIRDYDPGDIFNSNAEVRYYFSPNWQGRLFGNYTWYGKNEWKQRDLSPFFTVTSKIRHQEGELYSLGLGLHHSRKKWDADLAFRGIFREKNKLMERNQAGRNLLGSFPRFSTEPENSHGKEWVGDFVLRYFLDDKTTFQSHFQVLLIQKNDYSSHPDIFSSSVNRFVGRREKYSLGFGATRKFGKHVEAELFVKGFLMHDEEAFFPEFPFFRSERNYKGFSLGGQLAYRF